ncbi:MAG: exosortase/archaeosortase family protein [Methanoregulaceae archaeon]|nr:exosortase/archaeosortase family protein [Methanoregulaceae archaeon]
MGVTEVLSPAQTPPGGVDMAKEPTPPFDWRSMAPVIAVVAGLIAAFWPLMRRLPEMWFGDETYYAHGVAVPLCAALIVWDRWDKLRAEAKPGPWWAILPLLGCCWVTWVAAGNSTRILLSLLLIATCLSASLFILGWGGLKRLAAPSFYLLFALPLWDNVIDKYTAPLQKISAIGAYQFFDMLGMNPFRQDLTLIYLNNFTVDVGVACSGLRLVLAVAAIVTFFVLVAHLEWWKNLLLFAISLPLCVLINTLRITLIGIVGNQYGSEAGHAFHDYSGYISLVVSFLILMKVTKILGWKV